MKTEKKTLEALRAAMDQIDWWLESGMLDGYEEEVMKQKWFKKAKNILKDNPKPKRPVKIIHVYGTYMVMYLDRVKHGHYSAAQFNNVDSTLEDVKKWIEDNNLELKSIEI